MNTDDITSMDNITINGKIADRPFFMLLAVKSFEIFPGPILERSVSIYGSRAKKKTTTTTTKK